METRFHDHGPEMGYFQTNYFIPKVGRAYVSFLKFETFLNSNFSIQNAKTSANNCFKYTLN